MDGERSASEEAIYLSIASNKVMSMGVSSFFFPALISAFARLASLVVLAVTDIYIRFFFCFPVLGSIIGVPFSSYKSSE